MSSAPPPPFHSNTSSSLHHVFIQPKKPLPLARNADEADSMEDLNDDDAQRLGKVQCKPKHPLNAYIMFFYIIRQRLIEKSQAERPFCFDGDLHAESGRAIPDIYFVVTQADVDRYFPDDNRNVVVPPKTCRLSFSDLPKFVGHAWQRLDAASRSVLERRARRDQDEYYIALNQWKQTKAGREAEQKKLSRKKVTNMRKKVEKAKVILPMAPLRGKLLHKPRVSIKDVPYNVVVPPVSTTTLLPKPVVRDVPPTKRTEVEVVIPPVAPPAEEDDSVTPASMALDPPSELVPRLQQLSDQVQRLTQEVFLLRSDLAKHWRHAEEKHSGTAPWPRPPEYLPPSAHGPSAWWNGGEWHTLHAKDEAFSDKVLVRKGNFLCMKK